MRHLLAATLLAATALPAAADPFEEAVAAALDAYRAGDIALAREELALAGTLLDEMKSGALLGFLPDPLPGWSREDAEAVTGPLAILGGGSTAAATYSRGEEAFTITLTADSPMIAPMAAMLSNPTVMAMQGEVRRKGRQRYLVGRDGDVSTMVGNRVLVQVSGTAAVEDKVAHFEAIDFDALGAF